MATGQRHRKKEARPAELITAALALFHANGFAATRIEQIAQAAGVTKGTVYLYFPSKEALFKAAIRETIIPNLDRIEETAKSEPTARAQLRKAITLWAEAMLGCPGSLPKLVIAEAGNFPDLAEFFRNEVSGRIREMLISFVQAGVARGELRACDPVTVVRALTAPILFANVWRHTFPDQAAQYAETASLVPPLLDIVFNGIALHPEEIHD
ncbi:TetR/AcrR family transcriptional regulator [Propionivibrio soli]|uniref:TetR/AcrR family transcriptional regulator n=1 Tax=Propionivibrio soli TaxID=2976531 RepID=UPI0021E8541B|nr:TetR/AcrR family transcriptional regulator [Propionivibrio soli]